MVTGSYQGRRFQPEGKDRVLLVAAAFCFLLLTGRLFFMQVIQGGRYEQISEENRVRMVSIEAPRGVIYDRRGILLVDNEPSYTVSVSPSRKHHDALFADALSLIVGSEWQEILKREKAKGFSFAPVKVKRDISFDMVSFIEENRLTLPGVAVEVEPKRKYVFGATAPHVLGYTGEISDAELKRYGGQGYLRGWTIGKAGVERSYEQDLKGRGGVKYVEVDVRGQEIGLVQGLEPIPYVPGKNLHLALDMRLQSFAESVFPDGYAGAVVALDPRNGEVLVMVSKPDFDPNLFSRSLSPEAWMALNDDEQHPLLDRTIKASYPPGSTFKTITSIAGLETGAITVHSHFQPCPGGMQFGNRFFRCWASAGHGSLNLREAIAQSCDVYFYQLGRKVGLEQWSRYARMFGFGARTGIDLEGEEKGLVPDTEYYNKRFGKKRWSQNLIVNLSVGQGEILATPLQLAVLAGVIGAEGQWCQPHVVRGIELPETGTILRKRVVSRRLSDVSRRTLADVREAMTDVVMGSRGTGRRAAIEGVTVAGKTGTAQNPHGEDHALFICFAPAEDPAIAVAVVVENGGKGSAVAAPVARRIMRAYLYDDYEETSDGQAVAATE